MADLDRAFIIGALKDVMSKLHAMELALTGLHKAQAIFEPDRDALEVILNAAQCDVGELFLALKNEEEGASNGR